MVNGVCQCVCKEGCDFNHNHCDCKEKTCEQVHAHFYLSRKGKPVPSKADEFFGMFQTEMEKAYKIAQMNILAPKIDQEVRILRHISIRAKTA